MTSTLSKEEILNTPGTYKFALTDNNEWRFSSIEKQPNKVLLQEGEKAVAAGFLKVVSESEVHMRHCYAPSLYVGTKDKHWRELEKFLGVAVQNRTNKGE